MGDHAEQRCAPEPSFVAECLECDAISGPFDDAAAADLWHAEHAETCPHADSR